MKRLSLVTLLTTIMLMMATAFSFAEGDLKIVSSYPENNQNNTSIENLGVKLIFNNPINTKEAKAANADKFTIVDENGKKVPIHVLFSDKNDGLVLVLADTDKGFRAENNAEYKLTIAADLTDNDGNALGKDEVIKFKTYNQRVNNMVNMGMMTVMFGGIMVLTMRQNNKKDDEEDKKSDSKETAFNPYKEAKKTGKSVEEVMAEQAKKEEKKAKRKARKKKAEAEPEKKIDNCAEILNNVYHVKAPAPTNKEDRSIEAMKALKKSKSSSKSGGKKK